MDDKIFIDGRQYISAADAAREFALTRIYISRICKEGKVEAKLVGSHWYVCQNSMVSFAREQAALRVRRSMELAQKRSEEYRRYAADTSAPLSIKASRLWATTHVAAALLLTLGVSLASEAAHSRLADMYPAPRDTMAAAAVDFLTLPALFAESARSLNLGVDSFVYALLHGNVGGQITSSLSTSTTAVSMPEKVVNNLTTSNVTNNYYTNKTYNTTNENKVVGVSDAEVQDKLNVFGQSLRSEFANLTRIGGLPASGGVTNNIALTQRIDTLSGTHISNATISGGSLSGVGLSAGDLSGVVGISTGGTGTSTAPAYGKLLLGNSGGTYDLVATSSLGITGGSGSPGGSDSQIQFNNNSAFGGDATFTFSTTTKQLGATGAAFTNSTTTNSTSTYSYSSLFTATNATSTNFFSSNASTTNATSTSLFAVLGHFTTGVIDTLSSTIATITSLTATNLVATNSTTTNATTTSFFSTVASSTNFFSTNLNAGTVVLGNATTTNLFSTVASSTNLFSQTASLGTLTTGTLSLNAALTVPNGGTGWANIQSGALVYGNGTGAISTTTQGTGGQVLAWSGGIPSWVGTTTFSSGLTYASGNTACDTASASVFGCLTSAFFSKFNSATTTFSGGLSYASGIASLNLGNANTWTALQSFGNASSTLFSVFNKAYFGGTATSTFDSAGNLSLVSNGLTVGTNQFLVSGGNVGIGISPSVNLEVGARAAQNTIRVNGDSTANHAPIVSFFRSGQVEWTAGAPSSNFVISANPAGYTDANLTSAGQLSLTSAGALTVTSCTGCTSDLRLKTNIQPLSTSIDALAQIEKLHPVSFNWRGEVFGVQMSTTSTQYGVIAQEAQSAFPELVYKDPTETQYTPGGTYLFNYQGLIAPLVLAVQELNTKLESRTDALIVLGLNDTAPLSATTFAAELTTASSSAATSTPWVASFASASDSLKQGIMALADTVIHVLSRAVYATTGIFEKVFAKEVHTDTLCISDNSGETCVTKIQLDAFIASAAALQNNGGGGGSSPNAVSSGSDISSTTTPPIISVNGNNPATVNVGDVYADLGAVITGPQTDLNLGISASVDGATSTPMADVSVDTSVAGTHTVVYSATDAGGLSGTATRTVTVVALVPPISLGSATTTATTSTATSTTP